MSKKSRKEKQSLTIRVLAIVLAALLIGMIVAEVLPVFGLAEAETPRSAYSLDMAVDLENQAIAIRERLDYVNGTGRPQDSVWLNVYANTLRRSAAMPVDQDEWNNAFPGGYAPGGVDFISVRVNGEAADWGMSGASEQFMRVACETQPGERALIELSFNLLLPENNWALGWGSLGWRLVNFYPVAAVYDQTAGDFVLNSWTAATDPLMSEPADYTAALTLPEGWIVAATGEAQGVGLRAGWGRSGSLDSAGRKRAGFQPVLQPPDERAARRDGGGPRRERLGQHRRGGAGHAGRGPLCRRNLRGVVRQNGI